MVGFGTKVGPKSRCGTSTRELGPHLPTNALLATSSSFGCLIRCARVIITKMEPTLTTDPATADILAELSSGEPIFHRPELGVTRADFERMTVDDFWETGASGRRYSRANVLDELEKRYSIPHVDVWETSDFHCRRLADDIYLLTYTLLQHKVRRTRRATIWQHTPEGWKIVYHQGTIVQDD